MESERGNRNILAKKVAETKDKQGGFKVQGKTDNPDDLDLCFDDLADSDEPP